MKIKFLLLIVVLLLISSCAKETEVTGEVFIVTQGAGSYKFGLVEVSAIPEKDVKAYLDSKNQQLKPLLDQWENLKLERAKTQPDEKMARLDQDFRDLKLKLNEQASDISFYEGLPKSDLKTKTNADGKFTLKIPKQGKYALAAFATRQVSDKLEAYFWLVSVDANGQPKTVLLSNDNTTESGSQDSLLKTVDYSKIY